MEAYERMGCSPTWTCAPYQTEVRPAFGEQVAWGESSAIVFANSVLGARTERYPDLLDICCAITGRAPATGLHLERNRGGQVLVDLSDITAALGRDPAFFPVLGHWVGGRVGDRIPVLDGLDVVPSEDDLKALGAAMASSGAVALFHWVGVTPEAPDLATAFRGEPPGSTLRATPSELRAARADLGSGLETGDGLELVVLGSPHFSLSEFAALAALVRGRSKYPGVRVLVTTGRAVRDLAGLAGHLSVIEEFGAQLTVDTCILTSPMLPPDVRRLMTNSAKYAYYTPGLLERSVAFGSLVDCVESAVAGRVVRDEASWSL
jgi:predicted aconitase